MVNPPATVLRERSAHTAVMSPPPQGRAGVTSLLCPAASGPDAEVPPSPETRAERRVIALAADVEVPPVVIRYLNRLSDLLFVLSRVANRRAGAGEVTW